MNDWLIWNTSPEACYSEYLIPVPNEQLIQWLVHQPTHPVYLVNCQQKYMTYQLFIYAVQCINILRVSVKLCYLQNVACDPRVIFIDLM